MKDVFAKKISHILNFFEDPCTRNELYNRFINLSETFLLLLTWKAGVKEYPDRENKLN